MIRVPNPVLLALLLLLVLAGVAQPALQAQTPLPDLPHQASTLFINEVLAHTDPPLVDAVELYNRASTPVDLGGWCLSDDAREPCKACLPAGLSVPAHGYTVVTEDLLGFRFSEMGEEVLLSAGEACSGAELVDHVTFGASPNGISLGRHLLSTGAVFYPVQSGTTLGARNAGPAAPSLVLAEVAAVPTVGGHEYVEVFNPGSEAVPLYDPAHPENRWELSGVSDHVMPQALLPAGASIYFTASPPESLRLAMGLPASILVVQYAGTLRDGGERIALLHPEEPNLDDGLVPYVVVDEVGTAEGWPWSGAGARARTALAAFGQEPLAWGLPVIPLASASTVTGTTLSVTPAGIQGAITSRLVRWTTTREWRTSLFMVTVERLTDSGAPIPGAEVVLSRPASGSRHTSAAYEAIHTPTDAHSSYRYTLRVRWWDGTEQVLRTLVAEPESHLFLPAVRD